MLIIIPYILICKNRENKNLLLDNLRTNIIFGFNFSNNVGILNNALRLFSDASELWSRWENLKNGFER